MMDAIGQFASMLSGLGQAQAATPAQQAVAPTLVPAQQVVAQNGYTQVAQTVTYRAIALGWSNGGGWVVRTSPTLANASVDALRACNSQFGGCALSDAAVASTAFGCLVVAQTDDDANRLFAAVGSTLELAHASVDTQVTNAGMRGRIVYTGCNA